MSRHVVPAVIPTSLRHLEEVAARIGEFSKEIHIDLVDGAFVPLISWPYGEGGLHGHPVAIESILARLDAEVDFMVEDALDIVPEWLALGIKRAVLHIEACADIEAASRIVREGGALLGVSALNDTPIDLLLEALSYADYVQCMGIAKIGSQGQPFDERVLDRISVIRTAFPDMPISIDGSVNALTIDRLEHAGVQRFIVGSAVMSAERPDEAYRALCA